MKLFLMICGKMALSYLFVFPCCLLVNMSGGLNLSRLQTVACLLPMLLMYGPGTRMCLREFVRWRSGKPIGAQILMSLVMLLSFAVDLLFLFSAGYVLKVVLVFD